MSKKTWRFLESASQMPPKDAQQYVAQRSRRIKEGQCDLIEDSCEFGVLSRLQAPGACRCVFGVRYLVVHEDPLARPDMHTRVVQWAQGVFPTLAESGGVKVLQLW